MIILFKKTDRYSGSWKYFNESEVKRCGNIWFVAAVDDPIDSALDNKLHKFQVVDGRIEKVYYEEVR